MAQNTIDLGKISEYACAAELLARGIIPLWPSTEMYPYDIVADSGPYRHRVQVKATWAVDKTVRLDLRRPDSTRKNGRYTKKDTDFLIAHVVSKRAWYIFPVDKVPSRLTVKPNDPKCKWDKFLSAWDLLK